MTASLQSLSAARSRICCDARTPVNPKNRAQNNDYDDYGDDDLAVDVLYVLVRPSVAVADALRYGRVE